MDEDEIHRPVADVQGLLGSDEALVLFLDTPEGMKPTPEETFAGVSNLPDVTAALPEAGIRHHRMLQDHTGDGPGCWGKPSKTRRICAYCRR